jgi:peptidoglycan hydrolase-like protein with peptidoglycan-binding domain
MYKKLVLVVFVMAVFLSFGLTASAEDVSLTRASSVSTERLLKQIAELQAQIKALSQKNEALTQKLELVRQLKTGAQGSDVVTLQKILATDRTIYPEGLTTGFYGEKTKEAIKRLQQKFGLEVTGELDEKTKELINKILTAQGATKDIPVGLLLAPGLKDRIRVKLENKNGKSEYRIDVNSNNENELEVEVESQSHNRSKVKIDSKIDGKRLKRVFTLNTQNQDEIIARVARILKIDVSAVKEVIKFDDEDDSSDVSDDDSDDDDGGSHQSSDDDDDSDED